MGTASDIILDMEERAWNPEAIEIAGVRPGQLPSGSDSIG